MLCWLLERILLVGRGLGRSEKREAFWIKAWWASDRSAMNTAGREPIRRLTIGPCLAVRVRRKGSNWENDFRSHVMDVMIGM